MNNRRPKVVICSSASFYKKVLDVAEELKVRGFRVGLPYTAKKMRQSGNFDVASVKTWFNNPANYKIKTALVKRYFKEIVSSDAVLVVNEDKNGFKGYIGGNVLMELAVALHYCKPIFLMNRPDDNLPNLEEIYSLQPKLLDGNISNLKLPRL